MDVELAYGVDVCPLHGRHPQRVMIDGVAPAPRGWAGSAWVVRVESLPSLPVCCAPFCRAHSNQYMASRSVDRCCVEGCSNAWVKQADGLSVCASHESLLKGNGPHVRLDGLPPNLVDAAHSGLVRPEQKQHPVQWPPRCRAPRARGCRSPRSPEESKLRGPRRRPRR